MSRAINQALESSYDGVAHPISWKGLAAPRLVAASVKSEATFQQASLVSLVIGGKTVTFTPHRNGGENRPDKGFSPIDEFAVRVAPKTEEVCGETAFRVFEYCT